MKGSMAARKVTSFWRHAKILLATVRRSGRLRFVEVTPDGFGGLAGDYGGEGIGGGLLYVAQAAEVGEQTLAGLLADSGDVEEF
jgi:hypothetical protein